jgi:hypothetical protein
MGPTGDSRPLGTRQVDEKMTKKKKALPAKAESDLLGLFQSMDTRLLETHLLYNILPFLFCFHEPLPSTDKRFFQTNDIMMHLLRA